MRNLYSYKTSAGIFYIVEKNGRYHALFEGDSLGSYQTPQKVADDLAGGHTFSTSSGVGTATLGIPKDLSRWQRLF
jgi:hypothetical protein